MQENIRDIIIWGATGQAVVLEEFIGKIGFHILAVFDNNVRVQTPFTSVPIFYKRAGFETWYAGRPEHVLGFIVAIGGDKGRDRIDVSEYLISQGLAVVSAIHPTAYVADNASLGRGVQIMANATVCARADIGDFSIINSTASIDHECKIGMGVHIGPGAKLAGCVRIDDLAFIGTGAVILPRINIGNSTAVGAGAVVTKDLPDNVIAFGNPATIVKKKL